MTSTFANDSTSFANKTAPIEQKEIDASPEAEPITQAVKTEKTGSTCCGFCDSKAS